METTNALSGVEITEESRYIDHTNATPFEENCAEIQRYLKKSIATVASEKRIVNQSAGQSMTTVLKYVDTSTTEEGIGEDEDVIGRLFKVKQYVAMVATEDDMYSFTPSMKSYVYSSLITASAAVSGASCPSSLQDGGNDSDNLRDIAVFFYGKCEREIYGYHRLSISYCVDAVRHYISYILEDVDRGNPLYYLDGLLSTFQRDISSFVHQSEITKTVFVELMESFVIPYAPLEVSGQVFNDHPVLQNTIEDLWFSNYDFSPYTDQSFALIVKAQWKDIKHSNIIENSKFSTFQPSKLTPECWSVRLSYDPNTRALPLSRCLRKLFALYLFGQNISEKYSVSEFHKSISVLNTESSVSSSAFQNTKRMATDLSQSTRNVLDYMFDNASILTEKSDFEEYLMKLNARFLWVKREEIESVGLIPWNWLKELGAAPVGSWLSLAAIYVGSKDSLYEMLDIWQEFVRDLRVHQESSVPIARLYPPTPIGNGGNDGNASCNDFNYRSEQEKCHELFWDDIMTQKRKHGTPFSLPDRTKSVMYHKLQLLQMCILCKDESVHTTVELKKDDLTYLRKAGIVIPDLLRRMPPTRDFQLQQQVIADHVSNGEKDSDINVDHPLLKWQITHPAIVADCRAFKALNSEAAFEDFLEFYKSTSLINALDEEDSDHHNVLLKIFNACDAMHTREQKPLFKASMEGEKVLNYMESISVTSMASEFLQNAMVTVHFLLCHTHADLKYYPCFNEQIQLLVTAVENAVKLLKQDTSPDHNAATTLQAIDRVCQETENLEDLIHKLKFLSTATEMPHEVIEKLCTTNGEVIAETIQEAEVLLGMAKNAPMTDGISEWRSLDGRALRDPTSKTYILSIYNDDFSRKEKVHFMRADLGENSLRISTLKTEYMHY